MIDLESLLTYFTLISVPIGVIYHILTLRNQSRTRQFQIIKGADVLGEYVWRLYHYDITNLEATVSQFYQPESQFREDYLAFFNQQNFLAGVFTEIVSRKQTGRSATDDNDIILHFIAPLTPLTSLCSHLCF